MLDVCSNSFFIQSSRAHTLVARPEASAKQRPHGLEDLPVDAHGTLTLQLSDCRSNPLLRLNTQQHMDVIRHRLPFMNLDSKSSHSSRSISPACRRGAGRKP